MSEPTPATPLCSRGRVHLLRGEFAEAVAAFEEAARREPDSADAWGGLGAALFGADQYARAVEAFTRALALRPDDPLLLRGRGKAHFENNDNESAIADLDEALRLRPDAETVCFRGAAYHCLGEDELALDDLAEALRLDPALPAAYFFRGRVLANFGDDEGALADFDTALRLDPDYPYPYSFRASIWEAWGEAEKGAADRDRALRLKPSAGAFHSRAHMWQGLGEYDRAAADFAEAIRLEPRGLRHYSCRLNFWEALEKDDNADADWEKIQELQDAELEGPTMNATLEQRMVIFNRIQDHFGAAPLENVEVTERIFPPRVGADLQLALERLAEGGFEVAYFAPIHQHGQPAQSFNQLYTRDRRSPPTAVPPENVQVDVGEDEPVRCLKFGLWLLRSEGSNGLVLLNAQHHAGIQFQAAAPKGAEGQAATQRFFRYLEEAVQRGTCYRGKVLSLEYQDSYNGQACGIRVHKVKAVRRDQVILPPPTVELLERNVVQFVRQRPRLARLGLATKKGLLFYGPPGTGKTHTIHYLARAMEGQTTFLIAAEQVGLLGEYMTLARLFQPSMVVIEDVDLIARDRTTMHTPGEEVLLNKLLNEMDGLRAESDILFVLTTNRPEKLEEALASRPGRIDQAIEFPLPDAEGRAKLVRLYSRQVEVPEEVVRAVVKKTERVSASFIKELMRRATQFYLEREGGGALAVRDVESALEEMLFRGGSLNRVLLGAVGPAAPNGTDGEA
jgi:tetratricopeptide (TPR) repeat protein